MKYKINFFFSIGQLKFIKRKKKEERRTTYVYEENTKGPHKIYNLKSAFLFWLLV